MQGFGTNKRLRQQTWVLGNGAQVGVGVGERATTQLVVGQAHHDSDDDDDDEELWQPQIREQSQARELHCQTAC